MPTLATQFMYDTPAQAQIEVDNTFFARFGFNFNLGTKVAFYGRVGEINTLSDHNFTSPGSLFDFGVLEVPGFDALVVFKNTINLAEGEIAVVEGYLYRFEWENTSYAAVIGSSFWQLAVGLGTSLETGAVKPANVFRPWWDQTGLALDLLGASLIALAVALHYTIKHRAARRAAQAPAEKPAGSPPPPPAPPIKTAAAVQEPPLPPPPSPPPPP